MHKFIITTTGGVEREVWFDDPMAWTKVLDQLRKGSLEKLLCAKTIDYIRINWDNIAWITPVEPVIKRKGK